MNEPNPGTEPATDILEAVFTGIDEGARPSHQDLIERFPGREEEVRAALAMVVNYRQWLQSEKSTHRATTVNAILEPGRVLGDFALDRLIGEGGMGQVYRARQISLGGREVALKVLPPAQVAKDPRFVERFRREASLAGKVHHRGIAEVYGSGEAGGLLYFAMRLIVGRTLGKVLEQLAAARRLGGSRHVGREYVHTVVELVADVASSLGVIHEKRLVHRDVKPSNIILEGAVRDELQALTAAPVLVDFGLLRLIDGSGQTGSRTVLGTAAYASPEGQLGREVDPRADVFSLGVVLHDMLALTAPGERGPATAGLPDIREKNPAVDTRLAAILDLALAERKSLRYQDGGAFARELKRYLRGDPIQAMPLTGLGRTWLRARRDPLKAVKIIATGTLTVLAVTAIVFTLSKVYEVHAAATRGKALEQLGDLVGASDATAVVWHAGSWVRLLPGFGDDLERAAGYHSNDPLIPHQIIAGFREDSDSELSDAHTMLRKWLISTDGERGTAPEAWGSLIHSLLTRELNGEYVVDPDERAIRRRLAAETAVYYYAEHPLSPKDLDRCGTPERELGKALLGIARAENEPSRLRVGATSALSGWTSAEMLNQIVPLIEKEPHDVRLVAAYATDRIWWALKASEELDSVTEYSLANWARTMYASFNRYRGENSSYLLSAYERVLRDIAWTFVERSETSSEQAWYSRLEQCGSWGSPSDRSRLGTHLHETEMVFREALAGNPPRPIDHLIRKGKSFSHPSADHIRTLVEEYASPHSPGGSSHALKPELIENPDPTGPMARFFFSGTEPVLSGAAAAARFEDVVLDNQKGIGYLAMPRPLSSSLELSVKIPSKIEIATGELKEVESASVSITHKYALRTFLPGLGRAVIETTVDGNDLVISRLDVPVTNRKNGEAGEHASVEFTVDELTLAGQESITLTIRVVEAISVYRLYAVSVEFH